jgi:carbamoyltransferase
VVESARIFSSNVKGLKDMLKVIVGISAFGHDASAALVEAHSGEILFAISEERLSNVKHDSRFPIGSIRKCIEFAKKSSAEIVEVAVNFNESKFITGTIRKECIRILGDSDLARHFVSRIHDLHKLGFMYSKNAAGYEVIDHEITKLHSNIKAKYEIRGLLSWYFNWAIKFRNTRLLISELFPGVKVHAVTHHICHAATAYFNSGFRDATVITIDGQGESETVAIFSGSEEQGLELQVVSDWPNSLGIFYLMATFHLGFGDGDEYKVMGMSAYGTPRFSHLFQDCIEISDSAKVIFSGNDYFQRKSGKNGHFYYDFTQALNEIIKKRKSQDSIEQIHFDFAASIQKVMEDKVVQLASKAIQLTGKKKIALAGGVALNGLMNERIRRESGCTEIFVFPAAGDDGGSIGAAQFISHSLYGMKSAGQIKNAYLGTTASEYEIKVELDKLGIKYEMPSSINVKIAQSLAAGNVVARFNGRSEFGPRALGNRSILADPRRAEMKETLNLRIKHREPFRPFAPACLLEHVSDYFEIENEAPFMLLIVRAKKEAYNALPSVVHADGTARVQTISMNANFDFYHTVKEFKKITGIPVVINTSFNVNGETIVETPLDAIESFGHMDIDCLAIGPFWIEKIHNLAKFPEETDVVYLAKRRARYSDSGVWPYDQYNLDGVLIGTNNFNQTFRRRVKKIYLDINEVIKKVMG